MYWHQSFWVRAYCHVCYGSDGRKHELGRSGHNMGYPFLRLYSDFLKSDCFLNLLHTQPEKYLAVVTKDEYYAYHMRMHRISMGNISTFDGVRLHVIERGMGRVRSPFLMRAQEPHEEDFLLAIERIQV